MSGPSLEEIARELDERRAQLAAFREVGPAHISPIDAAFFDPMERGVPKDSRWCQACGVMPDHPGTPEHWRRGWIASDVDDPEHPGCLVMSPPLALHRHHLLPRSKGGKGGRNLICLCSWCHCEIHDLMKEMGL